MKTKLTIFSIVFSFVVLLTVQGFAGDRTIFETDTGGFGLYSFIDLRDRETFVQVTNTESGAITVHVQIFNVDNNCNENNFFDTYTGNDTHVYNMRDILTNNGAPSGVVLPDDAYGFVVVTVIQESPSGDDDDAIGDIDGDSLALIGNFTINDGSGYQYRTNSPTALPEGPDDDDDLPEPDDWFFNFNTNAGVTLSDVVMITVDEKYGGNGENGDGDPIEAADLVEAWMGVEVDIFNLDEVPFSCRNVVFACVDEDNPRLEELLEEVADHDDGDAASSVARFEYGINEAIPHSRGGELLCPGNIVSEGFVILHELDHDGDATGAFIGLNNGNGRGSMDSLWRPSGCELFDTCNGGG